MKKVLFSTTALAAAGALAFGASDALAQSKAKRYPRQSAVTLTLSLGMQSSRVVLSRRPVQRAV